MNLRDALQIWGRRWILTLLLLLVVLAVSVVAAMKLPKHYSAESEVVLLPSASLAAPNGHNPYLTYNGSLPLTAQVLSYQLMDPHSVQQLRARGYSASFTAAPAQNAAGAPILTVTVTGSNKNIVENTLRGVTDDISAKLNTLQHGIISYNQITAMTLSLDTTPSLSLSKTVRPLVVVVALGLVLALAIPLIVDGTVRRRKRPGETDPGDHRLDQSVDVGSRVTTQQGIHRPIRPADEPTVSQPIYRPSDGPVSRGSGQ